MVLGISWRTTLLILILIILVIPISNALAYEKENHYWLKIALALNCGFDIDTARLIAIGDFGIDEDEDTQPVRVGGSTASPKWKWHALPTEDPDVDKNVLSPGNEEIKQRQHDLYQRAMKENDRSTQLIKFGQYLHYTEDKWSHWGHTTTFGHGLQEVLPGASPDASHANPDYYRYMVFDSMVNLGKLAKLRGIDTKCASDLVPLYTYKNSPKYGKDFPWFSPQEIKNAKDPKEFQKQVMKKLQEWKKSELIDQNIYYSKKDGAKGVSTNLIKYISTKTEIPITTLELNYDFKPVDIDGDGNLKNKPPLQDFGIQRKSGDTLEVEQNQLFAAYPIKISTKNGFDSIIELTVSIEPDTKYVEAKIKGQSTLKIDPRKEPSLTVSVSADERAPAGEYKVTVTGKSTVNGKPVIRSTFFTVKVIPPPEILLEVNPNELTILQGDSKFTNTKFYIKSTSKGDKNLSVGIPKPGFKTKFSGDGKAVKGDWNVKPELDKPNESKLEVKVASEVVPGTYTLNVQATFTKEIPVDETYTHTTPVTHTVPLKIHVIGKQNPEQGSQIPTDAIKKTSIKKTDQEKTKSQKKDTAKPKPKTSSVEYDSKTLTGLYTAIKWAEYSQAALLDAINQYNKELKTQIKQDEAKYANTKEKSLMTGIIENKNTIKQNEKNAKDLVKLGDQIKKTESEIRKEADKKKILPADLNKAADDPVNKLKSKKEMTVDGNLKEAEKGLKKLESFDDLEYYGGVDPDKFGKDPPIPEDMKDLPGLGDNAVDLKVIKAGSLVVGDPCKETTVYFHWMLVDKKDNPPGTPLYLISEVWIDGKKEENDLGIFNYRFANEKLPVLEMDSNNILALEGLEKYPPRKSDAKTEEFFKGVTFFPKSEKERTVTFKIAKIGPSSSGFNYSGDGDKITIKIPACPKKPTPTPEPNMAPHEEERKYDVDSVVDDLVTEILDPFTGISRTKKPLVQDVYQLGQLLDEIIDNTNKARETAKKSPTSTQSPTQGPSDIPNQIPPQSPTQSPSSPPPQSTPQTKTVKLADRNRSAVQHSFDPCLTTHTLYYKFAFTNGEYPAGDKVTITETSFRGNLVHQGTLDSQGKYQIIIQNPPMDPGFEFRLTKYESASGNKLETALPDIWQFNVGPCIHPSTPGLPQPPSQPPPEQQTGGTGQIYFVQVFAINGKNYPIYQFVSSPPDSCNDYHFHAPSGKAYAIDGTVLNDPAPSGCGFGKTNAMGFTSAGVYKSQIVAWESLTGINIPEDD